MLPMCLCVVQLPLLLKDYLRFYFLEESFPPYLTVGLGDLHMYSHSMYPYCPTYHTALKVCLHLSPPS